MTRRRDFIMGGACAISAGAALALKPRRKVSLLPPGKKLSDILPTKFDGWMSRDVSDMYAPPTPDSLLARLYGETVSRIYVQESSGSEIMMLVAHGDSQSNELQLHRPEVCYPAFGLSITNSAVVQLPIEKAVVIPGRLLVAESSAQKQAVVYWTRLGEYFPTGVTEQRLERLDTAIHRYIPDGLLARFSIGGAATAPAFDVMKAFISKLVMGVAGDKRSVLVGTLRANLLSANSKRA
jgi:EpsI family protein